MGMNTDDHGAGLMFLHQVTSIVSLGCERYTL
jgi:hypothetical protein